MRKSRGMGSRSRRKESHMDYSYTRNQLAKSREQEDGILRISIESRTKGTSPIRGRIAEIPQIIPRLISQNIDLTIKSSIMIPSFRKRVIQNLAPGLRPIRIVPIARIARRRKNISRQWHSRTSDITPDSDVQPVARIGGVEACTEE